MCLLCMMTNMPLVNRTGDVDWKKLLKEGFLGIPEPEKKKVEIKILEGINELKAKLDLQNELIIKLVAMISKMYEDGEINKDTFNKLDEFLKPYYDNPYENSS